MSHQRHFFYKKIKNYNSNFQLEDLVHIKDSAESLLGKIVAGLRVFYHDKIYANHIGNYRIISVFPGAKLRKGLAILSHNEVKKILKVCSHNINN